MKNPLWIINSALIIILGLLLVLMLLFRGVVPKRESLVPHAVAPLPKDVSKINPKRIYENDLFKTYVKQPFPQEPRPEPMIMPPAPPAERAYIKKPTSRPEFLPPLDIELKGIIFNSNRLQSRIIVMNKKTKQEKLHKIGDLVEDAHLIYIDRNKAIFVRSNGQQEALFMNPQAAQEDPIYTPQHGTNAVEKLNESSYVVHINQFGKEIKSVAQFLDKLDITTAFDKGVSVGSHIGNAEPKTLGAALGFKPGDIIVSVNDTPTTSTTDRVKIYKDLIGAAHDDQSITVKILRNGSLKEHTYLLQVDKKKKSVQESQSPPSGGSASMRETIKNNKKTQEISEQTISQAQTNNAIADIFKDNDRKKMAEYGGRNNLLQR